MKRNSVKWEKVQQLNIRHMPYVDKVLKWVKDEAKNCKMVQSRLGEWEVEFNEDRFVVDLNGKSCSCYKWDLSGIPCVHAYACIMKRRLLPDDYIHPYYSKDMYVKAYAPYIKPMPGMKDWETTDCEEPLPPLIKKLPGRPSHKKRKKGADERERNQSEHVKRTKRQNQCGKCGHLGHNQRVCKNPAQQQNQKSKGGRPQKMESWSVLQRTQRQALLAKKVSTCLFYKLYLSFLTLISCLANISIFPRPSMLHM